MVQALFGGVKLALAGDKVAMQGRVLVLQPLPVGTARRRRSYSRACRLQRLVCRAQACLGREDLSVRGLQLGGEVASRGLVLVLAPQAVRLGFCLLALLV